MASPSSSGRGGGTHLLPPTLAFFPSVPVCVPTRSLPALQGSQLIFHLPPAMTTRGCWYSPQDNVIHLDLHGRLLCLPLVGCLCPEATPSSSTLLRARLCKTMPGRELPTWTISAAYPIPTPLLGFGSWSKKLARYSSSSYLESCQACLKPHSVQVAPGMSPLHSHLFLPRDQPSC